MTEFSKKSIPLVVEGIQLKVSAIFRTGQAAPILFLHGFGSTKEDYADILRQDNLKHFPFIAYDAPGCGETDCTKLDIVSIPFLVKTALAILEYTNTFQFHLIGHSMGGLTALMLAHQIPERVLSFINIEGNIAPEDCFLSRQIMEYPTTNPEDFFEAFIQRTYYASAYSSPLYATSLRHKVRAAAVPSIFSSMVQLSDNGKLMDKFLSLPLPRMFMYGIQNQTLSYLNHIKSKGVQLSEISDCGHFPMYSNPPMMWREISTFLNSI